jgi:hypothetical protein
MDHPPALLRCWILDEAYDDYVSIWELASVLERRQPHRSPADVHEQLRQELAAAQAQGHVGFWEGIHFTGEQRSITPEITAAFIAAQAEDWKSTDWAVPQVKLCLTVSGLAFFRAHCFDPAMWNGIE